MSILSVNYENDKTPADRQVRNDALTFVGAEMDYLSKLPNKTAEQRDRLRVLMSKQKRLIAGGAVLDCDIAEVNYTEARAGLPLTKFIPPRLNAEQRAQAAWFRDNVLGTPKEVRVGLTGNPQLSTPAGFGSFAQPVHFFEGPDGVVQAMKSYDKLVDETSGVTYISTDHGRAIALPWIDDSSNNASVIGEGVDDSGGAVDIGSVSGALIGAYSYMSRVWRASYEAVADLDSSFTALELFKSFTAKSLARGIGKDLLVGSGLNKPTGLITAVLSGISQGVGAVAASVNAPAYQDLLNLYFSLDEQYLADDSARWLMNNNSLQLISQIVDNNGRPLVDINKDRLKLMGIPILVCPSMDSFGTPHFHPIALGAMRFYCVRMARNSGSIRMYTEFPGGVEAGIFGLRAFVRADGHYMFNSSGPSPVRVLSTGPSV